MADPELGTKRTCPDTGKNFYDLNKDPIVSPYTGNSFPVSFFEDEKTKPKKPTEEPKPSAEDEDDEDEVENVVEEDDAENESDGDEAKELGGDEDEVALDLSGESDDDDAPGKVPAGFNEDGVDDDDDDEDDINIDDEFDLDDDIDIDDDNNELGEPDADDIDEDDK